MATHPSHDNVTYVNFGAKKRVTSADEVPRRTVGTQLSPAASKILDAVKRQSDQGRISRGLKYVKEGRVDKLRFMNGAVHARVDGSQIEPFAVAIILPYRAQAQLDRAVSAIAHSRNGLTRARRGLVGDRTLNLLLWEDPSEVRFSCDCPDAAKGNVCKHAVAVTDRLAHKVDADPSIIFRLRGMTLEGVEARIVREATKNAAARGKGAGGAGSSGAEMDGIDEAQYIDLPDFWAGRELPSLPEPSTTTTLDSSDLDLLHKAMRYVSYTSIDELRAVSDIEEVFDYLTRDRE